MQIDQVEKEGRMHPCNGYMLIVAEEDKTGLIVVRDPDSKEYRSGVVVQMSGDRTESDLEVEDWEWKLGDVVFFRECIEVDGHLFVHWTDIVAFRRF